QLAAYRHEKRLVRCLLNRSAVRSPINLRTKTEKFPTLWGIFLFARQILLFLHDHFTLHHTKCASTH
ncbi:hypothetical protein OFO11_38075, partial [Escherichia coli]|nr:hypothetical protein [Escherichia coli]